MRSVGREGQYHVGAVRRGVASVYLDHDGDYGACIGMIERSDFGGWIGTYYGKGNVVVHSELFNSKTDAADHVYAEYEGHAAAEYILDSERY